MSNSSTRITEVKDLSSKIEKPSKRGVKKSFSLKEDFIKNEIFQKLNEGTVLNYIRNSNKLEKVKSNISVYSQKMKYDLTMINKYDENLNSDLSFISEFDLEYDENQNDDSFNSSFDEHSVEEIDISPKNK